MLTRISVTWLIHRLSVVSPAEFTYRAKIFFRSLAESAINRLTGRWPGMNLTQASTFDFMSSKDRKLFKPPIAVPDDAASNLLRGDIPLFEHWVPWASSAGFWHTDPLAKVEWPHGSKAIGDYRPGNPTGDARTVWELNRLQHLAGLGMIAATIPRQQNAAARIIQTHLCSWLQANQFLTGINHQSAMEEALRVIAILHTIDLARQWLDAQTLDNATTILLTHGWHIERKLSLFSSTGNHTIAESVGLLYLGVLLPEHHRAGYWRETGRRLLAREADRQIRKDGGSLEQAIWYLLFIVDLLGLAQQLLIHAGEPRIDCMDAAIDRGRTFLNALGTSPDRLPRIGDGDDGYALSRWLRLSWTNTATPAGHSQWPDTGITIASFTEHDRLLFLHKDLGMPPNYGHGHSDALSMVWCWADQDVLIDPGTCLYGGPAESRAYFRSASCHNTVTIDGADAMVQTGPFLWKNGFRTTATFSQLDTDLVAVLAYSDGYRRHGYVHWRGIVYRKDHFLAVWDAVQILSPLTEHAGPRMTLHWHFGGNLEETGRGTFLLRLQQGKTIRLTIPAGDATVYEASPKPLRGWRAPSYTSLSPCTDLDVTLATTGPSEATTVFDLTTDGAKLAELQQWVERFRGQLEEASTQ